VPRRFYWRSFGTKEDLGKIKQQILLVRFIQRHVESYQVCAKIKCRQPTRADLKPIVEFDKPFDMVGMDILELILTSLGNRYCIVIRHEIKLSSEDIQMETFTGPNCC
jgi:uncharacterized metal-binding protein